MNILRSSLCLVFKYIVTDSSQLCLVKTINWLEIVTVRVNRKLIFWHTFAFAHQNSLTVKMCFSCPVFFIICTCCDRCLVCKLIMIEKGWYLTAWMCFHVKYPLSNPSLPPIALNLSNWGLKMVLIGLKIIFNFFIKAAMHDQILVSNSLHSWRTNNRPLDYLIGQTLVGQKIFESD